MFTVPFSQVKKGFLQVQSKAQQTSTHTHTHTQALTLLRNDVQRDCQSSIFNEFDNVCVRHADDGLSIHSQDPVAHLQLPTSIRRTALNDASNFMGHGWKQVITRMSKVILVNGIL